MIIFWTAKRSEYYPSNRELKRLITDGHWFNHVCDDVSNYTELEQIDFAERRIVDIYHGKQPYPNVYILSNSMIMIYAFRVAIKEGRLKPEDFEIWWYPNKDSKHTIHCNQDGDLDQYPDDGLLWTLEMVLTKLL